MKYTHIVSAYYSTTNSVNGLRPLNRSISSVKFANFYANNVKKEGDYITFESMNAWGQVTTSKFHKDNVTEIKENP